MRRRVLKLLEDVRHSGSQIQHYMSQRTEADYLSDAMLRDAIERRFEIIGEALRRLKLEAPEMAARIPHLDRIIGFRNVIAHQYDDLRDIEVWQTARHDLPPLLLLIATLTREEEGRA